MPVCAVATDLASGDPVIFGGHGDVITPIRSSCAYPGVFRPVEYEGRNLIDGALSMEMPVAPLRLMGATRVIAVQLAGKLSARASNVFEFVNRCFRILRARTETIWRRESDVVIEPDAACGDWRSFDRSQDLIAVGNVRQWRPCRRFENGSLYQCALISSRGTTRQVPGTTPPKRCDESLWIVTELVSTTREEEKRWVAHVATALSD